jgi:hypothetical protein
MVFSRMIFKGEMSRARTIRKSTGTLLGIPAAMLGELIADQRTVFQGARAVDVSYAARAPNDRDTLSDAHKPPRGRRATAAAKGARA